MTANANENTKLWKMSVCARDLAGLAGGASLVEESAEGRVIERGGPSLVDEIVDRSLGELVHGRVLARGPLDLRDDALLVLAVGGRQDHLEQVAAAHALVVHEAMTKNHLFSSAK